MKMFTCLTAAIALFVAPTVEARDIKIQYYSDRDGDGHYVKRTAKIPVRQAYFPPVRRYGYTSYGYPSYRYCGYGYTTYRYRPIAYLGSSRWVTTRPFLSLSFTRTSRSAPDYRATTYDRYDRSLEADVQRALRREGYYYGAIDGDIGPGSRAAIRAYQRDQGLAITGRIDSSLLRSLGI